MNSTMAFVPWRGRIGREARPLNILLTLAALTLFALFGCSVAPVAEREAQIAPDLRFRVPSPGELGYSISAEQLVTARYRGDVQTFEAHLSVSPQRLVLIGFDPFGRRAFTVTSGGGTTSFEAAPGLPRGLDPGNILADVAIVYWPDAAVERGLPSSAELLSRGDRRTIVVDGREIIRVDYDTPPARGWPRMAHYRNEAFGYVLDLRSTVTPP